MSEFRMPMLGADMEAGTLVEWTKRPGDPVRRGEIIAVVDTQKGAIEIEVFEDGVLERVLVQPGEQVPVGTPLAVIGAGAAEARASAVTPPPAPPRAPAPVAPPPSRLRAVPGPEPTGPRASPAARLAARELGVDLAQVSGTGPRGAITMDDVERTARPRPEVRAAPERGAAMRSAISAAMARSKREIPHFYLSTTIDMAATEAWLQTENTRRSVTNRLLPIALLLKAVASALGEIPELNGLWVDGRFRPGAGIHIGCAIALRGGGLVAPAVHDVDRKSLGTVMAELRDLVGRARAGALRSSELSDSTITVTNLGDRGVESTFGVIFPPQVALVGFGRIVRRPWVVGDAVHVRPVVVATLSADHRVVDGHRGGVFLAAVDRRLQHPEAL
jgi:pyruvate dehydrogenase E2 component (dihydrolipoamide acetyltransferase)